MEDHVFKNKLLRRPIVAILRGILPTEIIGIGRTLMDIGVNIIEVPIQGPESIDAIYCFKKYAGNEAVVGAGTVLNVNQVEQVAAAGGQLIVSPNLNKEVVSRTLQNRMVSIPGVQTITELMLASDIGVSSVKIFPGTLVTPSVYSTMLTVIPRDLTCVMVGGVDKENIGEYFSVGVDAVGLGTALYSKGDSPARVVENFSRLSFERAGSHCLKEGEWKF